MLMSACAAIAVGDGAATTPETATSAHELSASQQAIVTSPLEASMEAWFVRRPPQEEAFGLVEGAEC